MNLQNIIVNLYVIYHLCGNKTYSVLEAQAAQLTIHNIFPLCCKLSPVHTLERIFSIQLYVEAVFILSSSLPRPTVYKNLLPGPRFSFFWVPSSEQNICIHLWKQNFLSTGPFRLFVLSVCSGFIVKFTSYIIKLCISSR